MQTVGVESGFSSGRGGRGSENLLERLHGPRSDGDPLSSVTAGCLSGLFKVRVFIAEFGKDGIPLLELFREMDFSTLLLCQSPYPASCVW